MKFLKNNHLKKYLAISITIIVAVVFPTNTIFADSVTTSVTVGNSAPSFTVSPAESVASDGTTPTNAGSGVTIQATATDSNTEDYYLAICKTNSVTATNGGAPTCGGGNWCISSATTSGNQASCTYTTLAGDAESNDWYGFVCDGNSSAAACSSSDQGSGSTGSPFKVNHRPVFNAISSDSPKDPGATLTYSTDASTLDNDTDTVADTVKLIVCKTAGISAGDCDGGSGDRWCASSFVASNPTCNFTLANPLPDDTYDAYVYIVDNHNFAANDASQGTNEAYTVNNVAPVVSAVSLNSGGDITLTENTTTDITISGTITDNNSCTDISTVETSLYRSAVTYAGCDTNAEDDNNDCYAQVSCSVVGAGNTCTGTSDASADYTCTVSVQFHADPTDASTIYTSDNWLATINAIDDNSATGNDEVSAGVEILSLVAYDVTTSIAYGSLSVGQSNDPLDKITTVTATGNVGLDEELSGVDMTDGGSETIDVGQQEYALATSTAYGAGTDLTTSATEVELNVAKTTVTGSPATANTWWGIEIPPGTVSGSYTGTNTIVAVKGETVNW